MAYLSNDEQRIVSNALLVLQRFATDAETFVEGAAIEREIDAIREVLEIQPEPDASECSICATGGCGEASCCGLHTCERGRIALEADLARRAADDDWDYGDGEE